MNLNHAYKTSTLPKRVCHENRYPSAYHAAGLAAAICLGNEQNGVPPVYFQIRMNSPVQGIHNLGNFTGIDHDAGFAQFEGGLLITRIPDSIDNATKAMDASGKLAYAQAFEADIINLLAGPLAKAHYVAARDGEVITPRLVNLSALGNYCPKPDLAILHRRIGCLNITDRDIKLFGLYLKAFDFVTSRANWQAIKTIANFLLTTDKEMIRVDDIVSLLDKTETKDIDSFYKLADFV